MKEFSIVRKGGYDCNEVNAYIAELEERLETMTRETNEFKAKESAINNSIIEAQITAEKIRNDAKKDAANVKTRALEQMDDLRAQLVEMHSRVEEFQSEYNRILQDYLVSLRSNELGNLFDELESFMDSLQPSKPVAAADPFEPASPAEPADEE